MKIIISCAGSKQGNASFISNNRKVKFVAYPERAPKNNHYIHARPDDISDDGCKSWRERLYDYNQNYKKSDKKENLYKMLPAYKLYKDSVYRELVNSFDMENVFILSAGWGLIPADFLTPIYDITFSSFGQAYSKRKKEDSYKEDSDMLPDNVEHVIFLGGKDYQPLFCKLFRDYKGKKTIFYNSKYRPLVPSDFELRLYKPLRDRNWHYECAREICRKGNVEGL